MGDGHTGITNNYGEVARKHAFDLVLSYLKERDRGGYFVIHVVPKVSTYGTGLDAVQLLEMLRFEKSRHICQAFGQPCYYKYMFEREIDGWRDDDAVEYAHYKFNRFADSIDEIYSAAQRVIQLLEEHVDLFPWAEQFATQPKVLDIPDTEPDWLGEWRVQEYRDILVSLEKNEERRKHFRAIEYSLWGTGDELVDCVHYILSEMGLEAQKTKKGTTVDLVMPHPAKDLEIGIEVTGLKGSVKKKSNKVGQALSYLQTSERPCKAVILANTFNDTPVSERDGLDHFTNDAVDLMTPLGIVGLTTMSLYRIWEGVTYGDAEIDDVIGQIVDHEGGVYEYTA